MYIRSLAVASLILLLVLATAGAEDVKIMGLMETNAARSNSKRSLAYLTGSCQKKHKRMQCHLNEIAVKKLDTTLFEAKATEVMEQVKQDPHNVDNVIERQMPYLCPDPTPGTDRLGGAVPECFPVSRRAGAAAGHTTILCSEVGRQSARVVRSPNHDASANLCAVGQQL